MANPGIWFKSDVTDEEEGSESSNRVSWNHAELFRTMANLEYGSRAILPTRKRDLNTDLGSD